MLPLALASALMADQVLKHLVLASANAPVVAALGSSVRIRPVISDRLMAGRVGVRPVVLWGAWLVCVLMVLFVAPGTGRFQNPMAQVALGAALGGAAGNLFDMLFRKGVVDYVELGPWPAFNFADVAIVSGVGIALLAR